MCTRRRISEQVRNTFIMKDIPEQIKKKALNKNKLWRTDDNFQTMTMNALREMKRH